MLLKKTLFLLLFSLTNICSKTTLNNLSFSDLQKLQLNSSQIDDFLKHKKKYGKFLSYLELQSIPSFNEDIIKKIRKNTDVKLMFFERDDSYKLKDKIFSLNISFSRNFNKNEDTEEDKDKTKDKILGSLNKVFVKLKINHPSGVNFGIAGLKNRGEEFYLFNSNKNFPFIFDKKTHRWFFNTRSFFIEITNKWIFKNIIIGNFKVGSGQGLVFDNSFGFGKSLDPMNIIKIQKGIKSCCNSEKCKLLGFANTIVFKGFSLSTFLSYNFLDASLKNNFVYSAYRQLIYNTKQNIEKKDVLKELVYGGFFTYNNSSDDFEVGINFVATHFSKSFNLFNGANLDYLFSSSKNYNISVFSRWLIGAVHLFFEYAKSFNNKHFSLSFLNKNSGDALICGIMSNILKNIDLSCLFRKYNPTYYNFYGKGFFVNSGSNCSGLHGCACNEVGIYSCLLIKFHKNIDFTFSTDLFAVLNKAYYYEKMKGVEIKGKLQYTFLKNEFINIQCKFQHKKYKKHRLKKNNEDKTFLVKIYFKKNADICVFNTYFFFPFNLLLPCQKNFLKFHFGIYECINIEMKSLKFSIFFTIANTEKDFPMWIKEKDNKIWTKINSKYFKVGTRIYYNFPCNLKIDIFFSWAFKINESINFPTIGVNIISEF